MSERALISLSLLTTMVSMFLPTILFATGHERRSGFWWRAAVIAGAVLAAVATITLGQDTTVVSLANPMSSLSSVLSTFVIYMVLLPCTVLMLFRTSLWEALFFSALGYTMQNLGSSLSETTLLVMYPLGRAGSTPLANLLVNIVWYAVVYGVCYALLIRRLRQTMEVKQNKSMILVSLLVLLLVIYFDMLLKSLVLDGVSLRRILPLRAVHIATCVLVLLTVYEVAYRQQLRHKVELERTLRAEEERRWELSRENVDAINIKCHDIRHQIRALAGGNAAVDQAVLDDIAREVEVYDSLVRTGNAALDTILSEKRLVCDRDGIELTVMADGEALEMLQPAELYALVGNALDNAIEAARQVADPEERSVGVMVRRAAGMTCLHVENSFAGPAPALRDGLPQTTKGDTANHGFGMRSMRAIAERHGGTLSVATSGTTFTLDVLLAQ